MSKLSVTIITFNEEQNIERCLKAVKPVADEIIVVDSFSTDKTKIICQQFNVKFFEHPFTNYIEQKNLATSYTSYDYVLNVDADEVLSPELQKCILDEKKNFHYDAYFVNRLTNYCGQFIYHGGWYPDRKTRLWNKQKGQWSGELIHEDITFQDTVKKGSLSGNLLHYSYYSINQHIAQINRFTDMTALAAFNKGKQSNYLKILLNPKWKIFRDFILRAGFLDGYYGWLIAKNSAYATFLKYVKLRELWKTNRNNNKR